eukprot:TRINITY_DN2583_c0_g1_i1.p2 TRINITY_DN2583_c0_g1~~TRINITY_DN2583_c0_g1_i1.p2  ORF type:complete len:240 (+),score=45.06 TRINITY_DN2583_c0_g1_i1:74-793(+)
MCIRDRYQRRVHGKTKQYPNKIEIKLYQKNLIKKMGISHDNRHKKRLTGGRMPVHKKKRAYEKGRQASNTKLGEKRVRPLRVRGGNYKYRALRLNEGNFVWASEQIAKKTKILNVVYNATNNELVKTNTLVKNCIVQIDSTPYKNWYIQNYGIDPSQAKRQKKDNLKKEEKKKSKHLLAKLAKRQKDRTIDVKVEEQFTVGKKMLACVSSRPGQCGRCDGYVLEGKELEFYIKKIEKKR